MAPKCVAGRDHRVRGRGRVRKGGVNTGRIRLLAAILPIVIPVLLSGRPARGASLVGAAYNLNWDQKVDRKDTGDTETRTFKQTLDVKYRGFIQPVIENELTLKVEQEKTSDGKNTVRLQPILILGYKGAYWAMGAKRTVDDSNEPEKNPKTTDSYFVELFLRPARATLPDLKVKYNLDQDFEQDTTDTSKHALVASTVYTPMDWIQFKGDYAQNRTYDYLKADSDTTDSKVTGLVGIRHMVSPKIKFNTEYKSEVTKGWTILDAGGRSNDKKDTDQTWKNTLSFRPFGDTTLDASYDWDLKQNKVTGEDTTTENFKVAAAQRIGIMDLKGDFTRAVTEPRNTADDNRKTEDTWTADAILKFSKLATFTLKYQDKKSDEVHFADPSKNTTSASRIYSGSWVGDLTVFWKASASYDRTDTYTMDVKTTVDTKYSLKSTFAFKAINLILDPTYDITVKEDYLTDSNPAQDGIQPTESETKDLKVKLSWLVFRTNNMDAKFDHTYGRKTDSLANNIQRTDDTAANLTWKEPFPCWMFSFDVTRAATDTSGDDLEPDVNSSVGFKADFKASQLAFSTSYKYDIKTTTDDSETFDAKIGWLAPRWDVTLTYNFTKTFSTALNEGYTLSLAFKFIIN